MSDIELVIKIPEKIRVAITQMGLQRIPDEMIKVVDKAIQHGSPLPKGHGDLVDSNDLSLMTVHLIDGVFVCDAPTIIEADEESEGIDHGDKAEVGEWIDDKCSACGKGIEDLIASPEWYQNENPKYCPFCGIKIRPYKGRK